MAFVRARKNAKSVVFFGGVGLKKKKAKMPVSRRTIMDAVSVTELPQQVPLSSRKASLMLKCVSLEVCESCY